MRFHRQRPKHKVPRPARYRIRRAVVVAACLVLAGPGHSPASAAQARPSAPSAPCPDSLWIRTGNPGGPWLDLVRMAQLDGAAAPTGSLLIRRSGATLAMHACGAPPLRDLARSVAAAERPATGLWLLPLEGAAVHNSSYPGQRNDGALWAGRGLATQLSGGLEFRLGPLTGRAAPLLLYQQNADFDVYPNPREGRHPLSETWAGEIDMPQRFGTESFGSLDAGSSFLRVDAFGIGAGISNENIWWGPGRHNAILLGSAAPGFPHLFLETARPLNVWIGDAEGQLFWGRLQESVYFDSDPDNDRRLFAGLALVLSPRGADGLSVGAARAVHMRYPPEGLSLGDALFKPYRGLRENVGGADADNQLISLFFRWAVARAGMDVYGEWAREDHWESLESLLKVPDASQAFLLGLQKMLPAGAERRVRVGAEIIRLADALPILHAGRGVLTFYTHSELSQGHTHRGQLLGAWIGPGGDGQFLDVDLFWAQGQTGLTLERVRYNDDAYYSSWSPTYGPHGHDTEVSLRARHIMARAGVAAAAELGVSRRYNRSFLGLDWTNSPDHVFRTDTNVRAQLTLRWTPDLRLWGPRPDR